MSASSRRRKLNAEPEGSPHWMTTFSDMVTLLLVFFVLMYSLSVLDVEKFKAFITSFQGVGILEMGPSPLQGQGPAEETVTSVVPQEQAMLAMLEQEQRIQNEIMGVYSELQSYLQETGLNDMVTISYEDRGVAINIGEQILFDTGKANLRPEALGLLDRLAEFFQRIPYQVSIEGHTDSRPINTVEFPSNWELSSARAARVVRYLTTAHALEPSRFAAVGFGEFRPVAPNDTEENMQANRRVVMVIHVRDVYGSEGEASGAGSSSQSSR